MNPFTSTPFIHTLSEATPKAYIDFLKGLADNLDSDSLISLSKQLQNTELQGDGIPSLLSMSLRYHRFDVAQILLERNVDVNHCFMSVHTRDFPLTALLETPLYSSTSLILFENLPEPYNKHNKQPEEHQTQRALILETLLKKGANPNIQDIYDNTLVTACIYLNALPLAQILVSHGVDPLLCNFERDNPLRIAVLEGNKDFCQWLIEQGADINKTDDWGNSPIGTTIFKDDVEILEWLISLGGDLQTSNPWKTCLQGFYVKDPPQQQCFNWMIEHLPWKDLEEEKVIPFIFTNPTLVNTYWTAIAKRQKCEIAEAVPQSQIASISDKHTPKIRL